MHDLALSQCGMNHQIRGIAIPLDLVRCHDHDIDGCGNPLLNGDKIAVVSRQRLNLPPLNYKKIDVALGTHSTRRRGNQDDLLGLSSFDDTSNHVSKDSSLQPAFLGTNVVAGSTHCSPFRSTNLNRGVRQSNGQQIAVCSFP